MFKFISGKQRRSIYKIISIVIGSAHRVNLENAEALDDEDGIERIINYLKEELLRGVYMDLLPYQCNISFWVVFKKFL